MEMDEIESDGFEDEIRSPREGMVKAKTKSKIS
jgi:hypothetical protein